jgi:carbohydrate-binding DOMON domain-containing protein
MKTAVLVGVVLFMALSALAQPVSFKDPTGDDDGPGTYVYPTDVVYKRGSFDLTGFTFERRDKWTDVTVTVNATLEDAWSTGVGFAVQMVFIFIDADGKPGQGRTAGLPGLNVAFAPSSAWEKGIILSPLQPERVKKELDKAGDLKSSVIVPDRTRGAGRTITATFESSQLPEGDPSTWGYQVLMQSSDGFPVATDLLTRKVNEYEGQHRFGGGDDGECDPHVLDLLAGDGTGAKEEETLQHRMLAYDCTEGTSKMAVLTMVHAKK